MLRNKVISLFFLLAFVVAGLGFVNGNWSTAVPIAVIFLFLLTKFYGSFFIASNFYLKTLCRGDRNKKSIAITFDDGPMSGSTDRVLKVLKEKNVKATFFCVGKNIASAETLLKQIDADGHLIGNHSFAHGKWFDLQSTAKMYEELKKTNEAISAVINKTPKLFRPPYGVTNPNLAGAVYTGNYQTIGWSVRSFDTISKNKSKLWNRITRNLQGGDIVLFHDRCENTIELLPDFIDYVDRVGLKVVPLDQLLNVKPYA